MSYDSTIAFYLIEKYFDAIGHSQSVCADEIEYLSTRDAIHNEFESIHAAEILRLTCTLGIINKMIRFIKNIYLKYVHAFNKDVIDIMYPNIERDVIHHYYDKCLTESDIVTQVRWIEAETRISLHDPIEHELLLLETTVLVILSAWISAHYVHIDKIYQEWLTYRRILSFAPDPNVEPSKLVCRFIIQLEKSLPDVFKSMKFTSLINAIVFGGDEKKSYIGIIRNVYYVTLPTHKAIGIPLYSDIHGHGTKWNVSSDESDIDTDSLEDEPIPLIMEK